MSQGVLCKTNVDAVFRVSLYNKNRLFLFSELMMLLQARVVDDRSS